MKYYLFSSLASGIVIGLIAGLTFFIILISQYGHNFQELSFSNLLVYLLGKIGFFTICFSFFLFLVVFIAQKLFKKFLRGSNVFPFFLAVTMFIHFCFWVVLYANSNVLRFPRELKSYLADLLIILSGFLLSYVIYTFTPPIESLVKSRGFQLVMLFLCALLIIFSFARNPFALNLYLSDKNSMPKRNYDSQGNYLGKSKDISPEKWNILLFSIDTLRADGLGCYGNPRQVSPNIDSLAREGILFQHALAQSSWTLPSHMTMFTSLYPSTHGCRASTVWTKNIDRLNDYWVTLPEILKSFGFSTAAFTDGKLLGPVFNFDQGFDICDDSGGHIEKIAQKVIHWLETHDSNKPFFLFMHCYDVHSYDPPGSLEKRFAGEYEGKLLKFRKQGESLSTRVTANAFYSLSDMDIKYLRDLYDAEIFFTDREFEKVLNCLRKNNLYESTIIIVTSDHGEEFWEHGGTGHGWSLHQHQLKVPLIIKLPALSCAGRTIQEWVGIIDIGSTVLDILGIPAPNEFQGISLLPLIKKNEYMERNFLAEASLLGNQKCLIQRRYSFLFNQYPPIGEDIFYWKRFLYVWRNIMQSSGNELYCLSEDPSETSNVISGKTNLANEIQKNLLEEIEDKLRFSTKASSTGKIDADQKTREHLKSLGYIK